jgi:heat shock protein HslJ
MKVIGIITGLIVLIVAGYFLVSMLRTAPVNEVDTPEQKELSGTYVCLPQNEGSPASTDCAVGLHADSGDYYAIDFGLLTEGAPALIEGDRLKAKGIITPIENLSTDYWQKYPVIGIFSVTDSLEIEEAPIEVPVATSTASSTLTDTRWVWEYTELAHGTRREPKNDAYVLSFHDDLTYQSSTDCNSLSGTYVVEGEVLSLASPIMTDMFCEGSDEMTYVGELKLVNSYTIEADTLRLNLNRDYGVMVFRPEE